MIIPSWLAPSTRGATASPAARSKLAIFCSVNLPYAKLKPAAAVGPLMMPRWVASLAMVIHDSWLIIDPVCSVHLLSRTRCQFLLVTVTRLLEALLPPPGPHARDACLCRSTKPNDGLQPKNKKSTVDQQGSRQFCSLSFRHHTSYPPTTAHPELLTARSTKTINQAGGPLFSGCMIMKSLREACAPGSCCTLKLELFITMLSCVCICSSAPNRTQVQYIPLLNTSGHASFV